MLQLPSTTAGSFVKFVFTLLFALVNVNLSNFFAEDKKDFVEAMAMTEKLYQVAFYKNNFLDLSFMKFWSPLSYLVLDLVNCSSSLTLLDLLNETNLFIYPIKFVLLVEEEEFDESISKVVEGFRLLPSCEFVIAVFGDENNAVLHQPYKTGKFSELTWEKYGNWSLGGNLLEFYSTIPTPQRRSNLKQVDLNVVIVIYENNTWNHLMDYREPGVDTFTKQDYPAMMCSLEYLNIRSNIYGVDSYGYVNEETGEFSGLIHEIQAEKADVSVFSGLLYFLSKWRFFISTYKKFKILPVNKKIGVSVYFTEERFAAVDLMKMGNPLAIRFIVKKPSTSFIKNIFFITFTQDVWIASFAIMVISGIVVKIILRWENKSKQKMAGRKYTVSDVTLITLEAVCQQGTTTEPQSFAGRIIAVILFGAFMFIYVSYSANIVVLLQSTTQINNLQELLDSRIKAGGCQTHYMKNYFESVKKGVLRQLYLKKIYPDQYYPLDAGMRKLQEGNFAFHVLLQGAYEYILNNFTNYEICALQELPGYIEENRGYVAIPKHSPYKDLFKVAILKVDEYGLQRRTNLRIIEKPRCFSQSASFKSIEIYDCEQVFWIWIYGVLLAIFVFFAEKLFEIVKVRYGSRIQRNLHDVLQRIRFQTNFLNKDLL